MIIPNTAALVGWVRPGSEPICDRQTGNRGGYAGEDVEHAAVGIAVHRQIGRAGTVDRHVVGDLKLAGGQQDGAGDAGGINRVYRAGQTAAKRAGSVIGSAADSAGDGWQNNVRSRWCCAGVDLISGNGIVARAIH